MKVYILQKSYHLEIICNSRRLLTYYRTYAEEYPSLALFVSCDRMDQLKTGSPRKPRFFLSYILYSNLSFCIFIRAGKGEINLTRAEISIMGYLTSTQPNGCFFWNVQNVRKNASHHVWADLLLLEFIKDRRGEIPPTIYVCLDNSGAENKNTIYLKWCMLLVSLGVVDSVHVLFLPVGHTHWGNDQTFAIFSININGRLNGITVLEDFFDVCILCC
jgi:hypothetical protein